MPAEPGRTAPYANDLRWRVVWKHIALELPFRNIANNLSISVGMAYNIFKRFQDTGEVDPKPVTRRESLRKLDNHHRLYVLGLIVASPDLHLSELVDKVHEITGITVHVSTICRLLAEHRFTRKKVQHFALQRRMELRAEFMASVYMFPEEMFVWIDESGSDSKDQLRKYGYALRGERAVCRRLLVRGKRVSAIAAISIEGLVALELTAGSVDGDAFLDFIRVSLVPQMNPFDGCSPMSVAVMDNCSIHHTGDVAELFQSAGILLIYLPPYSPDTNLVFGYVKAYLKEHQDLLGFINHTRIVHAAFSSITKEQCKGWIRKCGY
jgi:transposase